MKKFIPIIRTVLIVLLAALVLVAAGFAADLFFGLFAIILLRFFQSISAFTFNLCNGHTCPI